MTNVLKELVEQAGKLKALSDSGAPFPLIDAAELRLTAIALNAVPTIKSLLSQEAELRELHAQIMKVATSPILKSTSQTKLDKGYELATRANYRDFADELSALIRRHHES